MNNRGKQIKNLPSNSRPETKNTTASCSNTTNSSHISSRSCWTVSTSLCPPRCRVKKEKKKKKEKKEKKKKRCRRCFVVILLTWAAHLPLSSAGARPAARLAYPGSFLVCASHLHTFLAGWRGLALIKASSHKSPPRILLSLRGHESVPGAAGAADDGMRRSKKKKKKKATRRGVRRQREGGREGEERQERKRGDVKEERATVSVQRKQEKAKEGKKKSAVEREREDKWVLCVQQSSLALSLPHSLHVSRSPSDSWTRLHFVLSSSLSWQISAGVTGQSWGQGQL